MAADDADLRTVKRLIERLESDDAFERRQAIENLALLTQQRLDFAWRGSAAERSTSVARWRKWVAREEKRRKTSGVQTALDLLEGIGHPATEITSVQQALEHAFKNLPEAHKKAFIAQMLAKVATLGHAGEGSERCERCKKRPATVRVTARTTSGAFEQSAFCEVCAGKSGT